MTNQLEMYIVDLLQGYLTYDGETVEVVKQFSQHPERPVVTLDIQSVNAQRVYTDPGLAQRFYEYKADININLWCDTEDQREEISAQIIECFRLEQAYHYRYCTNYSNGQCRFLSEDCRAVGSPRGRCTAPELYDYECLREKHRIIMGTLNLDPPFEMDEVSEHPPLLRSIFRCEAQYSEEVGEAIPVREVTVQDGELYFSLLPNLDEWKERVTETILDLDRRIRQLANFDELSQLFSPITHTHDDLYANKQHTHDDRYSQLNHVHSEYVSRLELDDYNFQLHNVLYITPFRVVDGLCCVLCRVEPTEVLFLEDLNSDNPVFTVEEIRGRYVFFAHDDADPDRVYHLLYYTTITDGVQDTFINVNNITANQGDSVTLYSSVSDVNNAPVNEGQVDYDLDYGDESS